MCVFHQRSEDVSKDTSLSQFKPVGVYQDKRNFIYQFGFVVERWDAAGPTGGPGRERRSGCPPRSARGAPHQRHRQETYRMYPRTEKWHGEEKGENPLCTLIAYGNIPFATLSRMFGRMPTQIQANKTQGKD